LNVAVIDVAPFIATVQVVPETALHPVHPAKRAPPPATAVKVTWVPRLYDSEQSAPQLIPAGFEVTVPVPLPALITDRSARGRSNAATTLRAASIVTVQVDALTEAQPVQPVRTDPLAGAAVNVTDVPLA
jgi:hypothetical protein